MTDTRVYPEQLERNPSLYATKDYPFRWKIGQERLEDGENKDIFVVSEDLSRVVAKIHKLDDSVHGVMPAVFVAEYICKLHNDALDALDARS